MCATARKVTQLVNYIERMAEVRVDMGNNTAEFGALGQVTVVSKSGSNQVHRHQHPQSLEL